MTWLCKACGTQFPPALEPPARCPICDDPRQYVPAGGQQWVAYDAFRADHSAEIREDTGILGIGCTPSFAIGQRALLVPHDQGNIMWDCIPFLDDTIGAAIEERGGLTAIAISHPHYYSAMVDWAHAFDCPVILHEADREWIMRPDPALELWSGEVHELAPGIELIRCGGHFDGGQVLHWAERRALLAGDIVQVIPDRSHVGFMYSYPNLIPLPAAKVEAIGAALAGREFDTIHGAWWGAVVASDGASVVRRSVDRYVRAVAGLPLELEPLPDQVDVRKQEAERDGG